MPRASPRLAGRFLQRAQAPRAHVGSTWDASNEDGLSMDVWGPDALSMALGVTHIVS